MCVFWYFFIIKFYQTLIRVINYNTKLASNKQKNHHARYIPIPKIYINIRKSYLMNKPAEHNITNNNEEKLGAFEIMLGELLAIEIREENGKTKIEIKEEKASIIDIAITIAKYI